MEPENQVGYQHSSYIGICQLYHCKWLAFIASTFIPDYQLLVRFFVMYNSAVPILIKAMYIDMFIKDIFPMERMIVHFHSRPVAFVSAYTPATTSTSSVKSTENTLQMSGLFAILIRVAKHVFVLHTM